MKSALQKLRDQADYALQLKNLELFKKCEVCGKPNQVGHHIYPKSVSSRLRYDLENIAHLCHGCHMRHHQAGDPRVQEIIIRNRGGSVWFDQLTRKKNEYQKVDRYFYLEALERLQ